MIPLKQAQPKNSDIKSHNNYQNIADTTSPHELSFIQLPQKGQIYEEQEDIRKQYIHPKETKKIYLLCLAIRLIIALFFTNTYHKPDQFFQGPEVAHHMVFGKGELAWEWTFKDPIRNPLFPMFYAFGYYLLKITHLHTILPLFSKFPFIQQAFLAALFDLMLVKINKHYNQNCSTKLLLILNYCTWVTFFYASRTYVNILETVLMMVSFYLWIKRNENEKYDIYSRLLVGVNFAVRGTSIIFWAITWIYELFAYHRQSIKEAVRFILRNLATIVFMIGFSMCVSIVYYKKITWVDFNFFYYNVVKGWSKVAGESGFFQYLQRYHFKALSFLVVFEVWGIIKIFKSEKQNKQLKQLLFLVSFAILILSLNGHKQLRFMFVYIPYIFVFIVKGFLEFPHKLRLIRLLVILVCIIHSWCGIIQSCFLINSTVIKAAIYLRDTPTVTNLFYFMPSYAIPMYSFVHRQNAVLSQIQNPYEEAFQGESERDQFLKSPADYLIKVLKQKPDLTHIIANSDIKNREVYLQKHGFQLEKQFVNTILPGFPNFQYKISLWKKLDNKINND